MKKILLVIYSLLLLVVPAMAQQFTTQVPTIDGGSLAVPMQMAQRQAPRAAGGSAYQRVTVSGGSVSASYSGTPLKGGKNPLSGRGGAGGSMGGASGSSIVGGSRMAGNNAPATAVTTFDGEASSITEIHKAKPGGSATGTVPTPIGDTPVLWMAILMVAYIAAKTASKRLKTKK